MIIIVFDMMEHEVHITHFCCLLRYNDCLRGKTLSWTSISFHGTFSSQERMIDRQTMVIQTWIFERYIFSNEQSESVTSKKTTDLALLIANDKIWAFKQKLEFWKIICITEFDSFPILKEFSMVILTNMIFFFILYNKMCQRLKILNNLGKLFSKWSMLWEKDHSKCKKQDRF